MLVTTHTGLELSLRPPRQDDSGYCISTTVRTVLGICGPRGHQRNPPPSYIDVPEWEMNSVERELRRRWADENYLKAVAVLPDDDWLIVGFVIGRPHAITFCTVRAGFTGQGVATTLLGVLGIDRASPAVAEFDTWDLSRRHEGRDFPIGLLNSGHWPHLRLVPWSPER